MRAAPEITIQTLAVRSFVPELDTSPGGCDRSCAARGPIRAKLIIVRSRAIHGVLDERSIDPYRILRARRVNNGVDAHILPNTVVGQMVPVFDCVQVARLADSDHRPWTDALLERLFQAYSVTAKAVDRDEPLE